VACPPFAEPWTLGPFVETLQLAVDDPSALDLSPVVGALAPLLPEWRNHLPASPPAADAANAARHQLFRAIAEVLEAAELDVVVIEDLHWADPATVEMLAYLA
jgi:hypothetical protein